MDWRIKTMQQIRRLMQQADPNIIEEIKYKKPSNPAGIPVWYCNGMICTGETYKAHLRFNFSKGALLKKSDPTGLINAYRAMLVHEGDQINPTAFKQLVRAAVALNMSKLKSSKTPTKKRANVKAA